MGDQSRLRIAEKESVLDDSGDFFQPSRQIGRTFDDTELAIQDVVLLIRQIRLCGRVRRRSENRIAADLANLIHHPRQSEWNHLNRLRKSSQMLDLFGRVGKYQEILRGASHYFFTEQRATAAFNQTEVRSELVGPVYI
jgi:hypothetical protein